MLKKLILLACLGVCLTLGTSVSASADEYSAETSIEEQNEEVKESEAADEQVTPAPGEQVAGFASQFIGRPYAWGGTSLTNGADCSGFVMSVYAHFGYALPHHSASMAGIGSPVSGLEQALPGDILVYSGHVGIYLGNGQMLSALGRRYGITVCSATYKRIRAIRRLV